MHGASKAGRSTTAARTECCSVLAQEIDDWCVVDCTERTRAYLNAQQCEEEDDEEDHPIEHVGRQHLEDRLVEDAELLELEQERAEERETVQEAREREWDEEDIRLVARGEEVLFYVCVCCVGGCRLGVASRPWPFGLASVVSLFCLCSCVCLRPILP